MFFKTIFLYPQRAFFLGLMSFICPLTGFSDSFESGLEAYQRGDYTNAYGHWYRMSQDGHVVAKANLGVLYMEGLGVIQNQKKAFELLQETALMGIPFAQYNLALMYEKGRGMARDRVRAHMWYNLAASLGHDPAIAGRANISRYMTGSSIAEAEQMASTCLQSIYQDC